MNLAYIQARGGSKRFPRKNLALWNGIPMVADAIIKAKATGLFDYIAVSSDDPEILKVAVDCGVMPLWRSPNASDDVATDDDVAREVLRYFPKAEHVCKMYPCIPLLTPWHIDMACNLFDGTSAMFDGIYCTDKYGKDAGAIYIFRVSAWKRVGSIALDKFNWGKMKLEDDVCQDINTPEDLELARIKAKA